MAIVKMKRLTLIALENDRKTLLHRLQKLGCVHFSDPPANEESYRSALHRASAGIADHQAQLRLLQDALDILHRAAPEKTGFLSPRPTVSEADFLSHDTLQHDLDSAREITELSGEISRLSAREAQLQGELLTLFPWSSLDIPLELQRTHDVDITLGTVPGPADFSLMQGVLGEAVPEAVLYRLSQSSEQQCLLLLTHRSVTEKALVALHTYGFTSGQLKGWQGTVQENRDRIAAELDQVHVERKQRQEALKALGPVQSDLRLCVDRVSTYLDQEMNRHRLLTDERIFCCRGWVPEDSWRELTALLDEYDCAYELTEPTDEEIPEVPVKLKNNAFTRSMNCITEQYSLPAYDGVDPNPFMAPFFVLFFGMMMADMAYGLLMVIGALVFLKKKRPADRSFMEMILWCGMSTFVFGALTGGFMGDFIPQLCRLINPASTFEMPALFTPLNDTMAIMGGSLVLGVLQIFTGMAISVVKKTQSGHFSDALWDEITWWVILSGIALMALNIGNIGGVPAVLVAGALMLLYGSGRHAKGVGKLIAFGGAVYNGVSGFFSDILSYVRLMALMLAGSVIAQVFNTLGATFRSVIPFVIVALVGNALNMALNLLGCYVHDMRLQFLEFFKRFYKEDGKAYRPLSLQSKHVEIIKEEN